MRRFKKGKIRAREKIKILASWLILLCIAVVIGFGCSSVIETKQETLSSEEIVPEHEHEEGTEEEHSHESVVMKVVLIEDFSFNPQELTIEVESGIIWVNSEDISHTIKSDIFNSDTLAKEDFFTFTFNNIGIYEYSCGIHPSMKGKIIVVEEL